MSTLYNQYIYRDGAWRQTGTSSDSVTYTISLSGDTLILTGSNGSSSSVTIGSLNSDIFVAEYNVTPYADILTAYNAGKALFVVHGSYGIFSLGSYSSTDNQFNFYHPATGISLEGRTCYLNNNVSTWSTIVTSGTLGNINAAGDITATATIANGDRIVINDESASKITNSSITFGTDTTKYLANNGTWQNIPSIPVTSVNTKTGAVVLTAEDVGALSDDTTIPSATSDLENDSNFVSDASYVHTDNNFTTTLKNKLDGISAGATVDDKTWNGVTLDKVGTVQSTSMYIPARLNTSATTAYQVQATTTPTSGSQKIALYDSDAYLNSTTPTTGDNTTKVATTAFVKSAVDTAISGVNSFEYEVVQTLPTTNIKNHTIYLVPKTAETNDIYDEYMYINNAWEHIGSTDVDLSGYVPTSTKINGKSLTTDITLTASDVSALPSNTSIPSATSDLTNDSGFITLSDATTEAEKTIQMIPYGHLDDTSTSTVMTATVPGITKLENGVTMLLRNGVVTSASGFTINVNELGAKPVYSSMDTASRSTTIFNTKYTMLFVYDEDRVSGGCWVVYYGYDSNTTMTYGHLSYYYRPYAGEAIYRYKFVMRGADGRLYPIVTTNQADTTQVAKVPTTVGLKPHNIWWYNTTSTISAGSVIGANTLMEAGYSTTAVYNFNTSTGTYKDIYLRGTYDKDKDLFYLYKDSSNPCTSYYAFVPNNTANINLSSYLTSGYYYLHLGASYSTTNYFNLLAYNEFYYFDGTSLIPVSTKITNDAISSLSIPSKTSDLQNDSGFISTETDPTVPAWAKASSKPSYTASEVGAATSDHTHTLNITTDSGTSALSLAANTKYKLTAGGNNFIFTTPPDNNTNYYHTTGSWSGLTYTATANGGAGALAFTIPTGTTSTTVSVGNHTHDISLDTDTGTSTITLASAGKYKLTAGGKSVIFTMPTSNNYTHPTYDAATAAAKKIGRDSTGHVVIGDTITASDVGAAESNHTHTTTLATDTGTSSITLVSAGKYKLTAGGTSVIFTMPTIPTVSYPVTSVNGKTGAVTLSASDVSALPSNTTYVSSVNGSSGAVTITDSDEKVKQTPLNGTNSNKGLLFASNTGSQEVTSTIYTSNKISWNDNGNGSLKIYDSNKAKCVSLQYNSLGFADSNSSYIGNLTTTTLTATRTYSLPDKGGTIALTSDIPSIPSQTNNSGKFLTTNGTTMSWGTVDALPSQSGNSGKFLTTNGTTASWATVDALPSQSGNSGKFLTTNGTTASWATINALPSQTGNSGKFLTTDGSTASWGALDTTPTENSSAPITSGAVYSALTTKQSKFTVTTATMAASSWSNGVYSALQTTYPAASYDIDITVNGDSITVEQLNAWNAAQIVGSAVGNTFKAMGTVPSIDIPIIVKVTPTSDTYLADVEALLASI